IGRHLFLRRRGPRAPPRGEPIAAPAAAPHVSSARATARPPRSKAGRVRAKAKPPGGWPRETGPPPAPPKKSRRQKRQKKRKRDRRLRSLRNQFRSSQRRTPVRPPPRRRSNSRSSNQIAGQNRCRPKANRIRRKVTSMNRTSWPLHH